MVTRLSLRLCVLVVFFHVVWNGVVGLVGRPRDVVGRWVVGVVRVGGVGLLLLGVVVMVAMVHAQVW